MPPAREAWEQIQPILDGLLAMAPGDRLSWLADLANRDVGLHAEISSLLIAIDAASDFLETPALAASSGLLDALTISGGDAPDPMTGKRVGPYQILREIGSGGMGTVYLAARADDQYQKEVAIKLVAGGFESAETRHRFLAERQILASLHHPNIASLFDGGVTEAGTPYIVMEYIDGLAIDEYCDVHRLTIDARLELFDGVCRAVQFAHQNLVVHRDIKPGNILVTAAGVVKLVDFGIAKLDKPTEANRDRRKTESGRRLLTPEYASPEQLSNATVTTASDVYQLGSLLLGLLTGARPHRSNNSDPAEITRLIRLVEPRVPSSTAGDPEAAKVRGTTPAKLRRRLRGDLDQIVLRSLRKEPHLRYASVGDFQADLHRHRDGRPVSARRGTRRYRARKFIGRHWPGVTAVVAVGILLAGTSLVTRMQARRIVSEHSNTERVATFLIELLASADPDFSRGRNVTARELLDLGALRIERDLAGQPEVRARLQDAMGRAYVGLGLYDAADRLLTSAVATQREIHGPTSPEAARAAFHLAYLRQAQDQMDSAELLFREALTLRRALYDDRHPDVVASLNGLAYVLRGRGDFLASEAVYREALALERRPPALHDSLVATTLSGLGVALNGLGRFDEAEPIFREALAINRALLGDVHPHININLYSLAKLLHDKGDLIAAEPLYREALAVGLRVFGEQHPLHAIDLVGLARLLKDRHHFSEAEVLYRKALAIQQAVLPAGHARTNATLRELSKVLTEQSRVVEADVLLRSIGADNEPQP
jgi:serine/threonine-protein kinase